MQKRACAIEDIMEFRIPGHIQLGPDVAIWTERMMDLDLGKPVSHLMRGNTDGDAAQAGALQLTQGPWSCAAPRISPDGKRVAFVRSAVKAGGEPGPSELCVMPVAGGEVRVLAAERGAFGAPGWSPDSARLVVSLRRHDPVESDGSAPLSIRVTRLHYKEDGQGYLPGDRYRLYLVSPDDSEPALTPLFTGEPGDWDDTAPAWSPNGDLIAFMSNRRENRDHDVENNDIFVIPAAGGAALQCSQLRGPMTTPAWAPDSTWLAVPACPGPPGYALSRGNMHLFKVWPDGSREEEDLTPDLDRNVVNLTIDDIWGLDYMGAGTAFSGDGRTVYIMIADQGTTWLAGLTLDAAGKPAGLNAVVNDRSVVCFAAFGDRVATITTTPTEPGRIELCDDKGEQRSQLAWPMAGYCERVELMEPEEFRVTTGDGNQVHGWLLLPAAARDSSDQTYPLLLLIHGGPVVQFGRTFFHEIQTYAARGYAVLYVNPRGSQGYGSDFAGAIHRNWGAPPFTDLMAAVDHALATYPVDPERMGVLGGSYGGYMTTWVVAHSNRFKAACTQRTVSSLEAMIWCDYGATIQYDLGGSYQDDPDLYLRLSPITYAARIDTPMLIMQGLDDRRTPADQGERLYVTLRLLGKEAEMVLFPGATHDLSRNGPPRQRIERLRCIHEWFDRHLG